jgi:hypothetical protein
VLSAGLGQHSRRPHQEIQDRRLLHALVMAFQIVSLRPRLHICESYRTSGQTVAELYGYCCFQTTLCWLVPIQGAEPPFLLGATACQHSPAGEPPPCS